MKSVSQSASEHNFFMAVTGEYENVWSSGVSPAYKESSDPSLEGDLEAAYSWLGILPPMPPESPEGWRLIRIPISTLDQDRNGNIYGISFEFFSQFGEVLIDEIRFISED